MAILLARGVRLAADALVTALRGFGYEVTPVDELLDRRGPATVDVVLICCDERTREALAAIRRFGQQFPGAHIVLIGEDHSDHDIVGFLEAGAHAYTSTSASLDDLVEVIEGVKRGESPCSGRLAALVLSRIAELARAQRETVRPAGLTVREQEVHRLLGAGFSNKEIANHLSISTNTVKIHVHRILEKLQVRRRREVAKVRCRTHGRQLTTSY